MNPDEAQAKIDSITWYHEFDFPDGLVARTESQARGHRRSWAFIRSQLDKIDMRDKSVLDLGCWDGYWSFYAEQRGARRVLATDDNTQNWAGSAGLLLAKELFGSNIETRLEVSVYDLSSIEEQFDVIFCLGLYYHLYDPLYAFSQIRHRCHENTIVVFEGDTATGLKSSYCYWDPTDGSLPAFVPHPNVLANMLGAAYLEVVSQTPMVDRPTWSWREYAHVAEAVVHRKFRRLPRERNRTVTVCRPIYGHNRLHPYPPPFGLAQYDERF
jgi:tRNA (mo5U34)-methyltransferase